MRSESRLSAPYPPPPMFGEEPSACSFDGFSILFYIDRNGAQWNRKLRPSPALSVQVLHRRQPVSPSRGTTVWVKWPNYGAWANERYAGSLTTNLEFSSGKVLKPGLRGDTRPCGSPRVSCNECIENWGKSGRRGL